MLKKTFFSLALALFVLSAHAQIKLIGLLSDVNVGTFNGLRWDAQTGVVSDTVPTTETGVYMGSSVFDASTGQYYFLSNVGLHMVDFAPDSFASLGFAAYNTSAEIDMANGKIFGVDTEGVYDAHGNLLSINLKLMRYSLSSGQDSVMGIIPGIWGVLFDASTYNSNTGEYYVVVVDSTSNYQIISMTTRGAFSYTRVPVTSPTEVFIGLEYDNEYNILYGMTVNTVSNPTLLDLYQVNPITGALTLETPLPGVYGIVGTSETFDQTSSSFIFVSVDSLGGYKLQIYNTVQNTMSFGVLPDINLVEFEADNSQFAAAKYGSLTALPAPVSQQLRTYPNPARDVLRIQSDAAVEAYTLRDLQGRTVATGRGTEVALDGIAPGLYLLQGKLADGIAFQVKFVKE
jgi:hypothetical protein